MSLSAPAPLDGIRVLDFTSLMAGPSCSRYLADLGAEVIKVETGVGDLNRSRAPMRDGWSATFGQLNTGKKSVKLDLKSQAGKEAAVALGVKSDVILENWRPGVGPRLGVGYEDFSRLKPDIVYCSISGYGQTGPNAGMAAYAGIIHAASGYELEQMRHDRRDIPSNNGVFIADMLVGVWAALGVQAALFHRERTGRGQYVDVAMLDAMLNLMVFEIQYAQCGLGMLRAQKPLRASDGYILALPVTQANFEALSKAVGHPEWIDTDERFVKQADRDRNWFVLLAEIEKWTVQRSARECEAYFSELGIPVGRFRTVEEVLADPHCAERGTFTTIHDGAGAYKVPNSAYQMPGLHVGARDRVPRLGEDTESVLRDVLGYDEARIRACMQEGK
jgi:crotonobetainyl-CoA:carnitine CoA-transferase CaiB-like acyl-CoA transferase